MRCVVQRVSEARVSVEGEVTGEIGAGILVLAGFSAGDTEDDLAWMAKKCAKLRIFRDDDGKMNRSVVEAGGEALCVSQFTLYGDARKGNRPSYIEAAPPEVAEPLYERFCARLADEVGRPVARGRFGAYMQVALVNDGPVTIWLER